MGWSGMSIREREEGRVKGLSASTFHKEPSLLTFRGEAVYRDSRGRDCVSMNAASRILGISRPAALYRIRSRSLPAEYRGDVESAVWLIPVRAVELCRPDPKWAAYGRIKKRWPLRGRTYCWSCRKQRTVDPEYRCIECSGELRV